MNPMLAGAIAMASIVISLFFLRFWRGTHDRLFLFFALSFLLEALNRILLGLSSLPDENAQVFYIIRLLAYMLILFAIFDKNRQQKNMMND